MTKEEFVISNKLADRCLILEPWKEFSPAIETVIDHKHIVYDYCQLVSSLAEAYKKNSPQNESNEERDYLGEASDWVEYNTMRSLPYYPAEFRPFVVYISKEVYDEYIKRFKSLYGEEKIDNLLNQVPVLLKITQLRQDCYGDVSIFERQLTKIINFYLKEYSITPLSPEEL